MQPRLQREYLAKYFHGTHATVLGTDCSESSRHSCHKYLGRLPVPNLFQSPSSSAAAPAMNNGRHRLTACLFPTRDPASVQPLLLLHNSKTAMNTAELQGPAPSPAFQNLLAGRLCPDVLHSILLGALFLQLAPHIAPVYTPVHSRHLCCADLLLAPLHQPPPDAQPEHACAHAIHAFQYDTIGKAGHQFASNGLAETRYTASLCVTRKHMHLNTTDKSSCPHAASRMRALQNSLPRHIKYPHRASFGSDQSHHS